VKKRTIAAISLGTALVVLGGGYGIYHLVSSNSSPVEVTSVSSLNSGWWGESTSTYGYITSTATQEVHLDSDELVDTLYVSEGDTVKIGDKLLSYDTTLLEIDLEAEKLERQSIKLQIKQAKAELEKLKKITPVSDSYYSSTKEDAATLTKQDVVLTSTSEQVSSESETEKITEAETQATETTATETTAPETSQTGSQTPSTEQVLDPSKEETEAPAKSTAKVYSKLDYNAKPAEGSGTKDDPYIFYCKENTTIYASFMNKILGYNKAGTSKKKGGMKEDGKGCYAVLEIRDGSSTGSSFMKSVGINGTVKVDSAYAPDVTWTFGSDGVTKDVPDVDEPDDDQDDDDLWDDDWDDGWADGDEDIYTASELKEAIAEKEDEIKDLKLDLREARISVAQAKRKLDDATVTATINGVVKSVGDPALGEVDGEAFLTVTSAEGMYVKGTISELKLGEVGVGSTMTGMSYESGTSFTAKITEISEYPTTSDSWSSNDANASSYSFMAYIEEPGDLSNNEYVELSIESDDTDASAIYLYKAYIRSENGQSYVYKADENDRLVKQYIKTGATVYSYAVEVKSGLSLDDKIAFPYGKNVKEGAKTVEDDDDSSTAAYY
jgi:multidrug efflux pump subunit AcrA (membrane-fusion protein)